MEELVELLKAGDVRRAIQMAQESYQTGIQNESEEDKKQRARAMRKDRVRREIEHYNSMKIAPVDGINCEKCGNKGLICMMDIDYNGFPSTRYIKCSCQEARINMRRIKASGLEDELERCTFENFQTSEPFQKYMLSKAQDFLADTDSSWLYFGGQVGCGKTHLCTAVCGVLLKERHIPVKYMLWKEESTRLKALVNSEDYAEEVNKYKTVPVLYIDDLFKKQRSSEKFSPPTDADINLAFEIINARYIDKSKITIVSCEWLLDDLLAFDEATASRIYERAKKHWVEISRDEKRNYRIRRNA